MGLEIERKFLVISEEFKKLSSRVSHIKQGYLNSDKNRTVRVRIHDKSAFLTIKGISDVSGTTRFEWEKEISYEEATELIKLCEHSMIEKRRYYHNNGDHLYEVDEFLGENKGLVLAEIELKDVDEEFKKPTYLGDEVTGTRSYYNAYLSKNPYKNWTKKNLELKSEENL